MRINYLITAFANELHLRRLFSALRTTHADIQFLVHWDKKMSLPDPATFPRDVRFIESIPVWWAGWSHQQAILNLAQRSVESGADWHILLSGSDYPLRSNEDIIQELTRGRQVITLRKGFFPDKPKERVEHFYFDNFDRRNKNFRSIRYLALERLLKTVHTRKMPFDDIYHGTTWWALSNDCLSYVVEYLREHPEMSNFYKNSFCAEESMFHTILGNSPFCSRTRNAWIYQDWSVSPGPGPLTMEFLQSMSAQDREQFFFARKFSDSSGRLREYIDGLRHEHGVPLGIAR
jgi:hypothetical protein